MDVYLMRHAHAVEPDEWAGRDAERPLTDKGRKAAEAVARGLARESPPISQIVSSPYARAFESAQIVGRRLGIPVIPDERLAVGFSLDWLPMLFVEAQWPARLLAVGHQPSMGGVAAALMGQPGGYMELKKAAVARVALPDGVVSGGGSLAGIGTLIWLRTWREWQTARGE